MARSRRVSDGRGFEVTTLRRDVETDGRHAVVAFTDDWRADAARRDFTINAMSMTRAGEVFDYFGGIGDLRAGILRFVGDPATRIAEDYLRILRYFRFFARYAGGPADPAALAAIRAGVPGLAGLSVERVWSELARILSAPDPRAGGGLDGGARRAGSACCRKVPMPARLARLVAAGAPADPLLRLAALLTGDAAALAARLRLSAAERDRLVALRTGPVPRPGDDDATLRRLLADEAAGDADRPDLARRRRRAGMGGIAGAVGRDPASGVSAGGARRAGARRTGRPARGCPAARGATVVAGWRLCRGQGGVSRGACATDVASRAGEGFRNGAPDLVL